MEAEADDGLSLPRLSDADLLESEKETLEGNRSAIFGLSGDITVYEQLKGVQRVDRDDGRYKQKETICDRTRRWMRDKHFSDQILTKGSDGLRTGGRDKVSISCINHLAEKMQQQPDCRRLLVARQLTIAASGFLSVAVEIGLAPLT